jgi:hypothetical protein
MNEHSEIKLLRKVQELLNKGYNEIDIVDHVEDLFGYLNLLERYYIHSKRYDDDSIVANAKDEIDVDPQLVKEMLEEIAPGDEKALSAFIDKRIKLFE